MQFETIQDLHNYTITVCQQLHPEDLDLLFISGSIARGTATAYSDVDYTACVAETYSHPAFKFFVAEIAGTPRIVSIYFYHTPNLAITQDQMDEEHYLWEKNMMQYGKAEYVFGNKTLFSDIIEFYKTATYEKKPKSKSVHKSTGKLLELLVKVRKYKDKNDLSLMIYYGMKIAEHCRRIVFEANPPLSLNSESEMLSAILSMSLQPENFSRLYLKVARINGDKTNPKMYFRYAYQLVEETLIFVVNTKSLTETFGEELFRSPILLLLCHIKNGSP